MRGPFKGPCEGLATARRCSGMIAAKMLRDKRYGTRTDSACRTCEVKVSTRPRWLNRAVRRTGCESRRLRRGALWAPRRRGRRRNAGGARARGRHAPQTRAPQDLWALCVWEVFAPHARAQFQMTLGVRQDKCLAFRHLYSLLGQCINSCGALVCAGGTRQGTRSRTVTSAGDVGCRFHT